MEPYDIRESRSLFSVRLGMSPMTRDRLDGVWSWILAPRECLCARAEKNVLLNFDQILRVT